MGKRTIEFNDQQFEQLIKILEIALNWTPENTPERYEIMDMIEWLKEPF